MSKLSKLYELRRLSQEFGMEWTEKQERQLEAEEEHLIKNEVLPVVTKSIEPALSQVERELVLVVDYVPGVPLKVSLSRKRNLFDALEGVVEIKPDPEVEHTEKKKGGKKVVTNPRTRLKITMPDGSIIEEHTAWESLQKFILRVGVEKVRAVGLIANKIPLVSNTVDKKYKTAQKPLGNGWLLMTCSDTATKRKQILTIASHMGIKIKVDVI
ncbi:hypothetical protein [Bacteroides acidifaciens]|uniref:hypothetical protein n=1 Tax=Bacteroides acidifaciens TaxID=85831 RepID=UPI00258D3336|nr:hypothetical protein [Bacteroides acidifaciens]